MQFKQGTDMDIAYREVRDRVERARARLPDDVQRVFIRKDDDTGIPVALYGLTIDPSVTDSYDLIRDVIVARLERIEGVPAVEIQGQLEKEILSSSTASAPPRRGSTSTAWRRTSAATTSPSPAAACARPARSSCCARSPSYRDVEQLRQRPLAPGIRLGDVATIRYAQPEKTFRVRAMSLPAVAVQVFKEGDANTVEVAGRVAEEIELLEESPRLAGIGIEKLFNQKEIILESLGKLVEAGALGSLFAVLCSSSSCAGCG